MLVIVIFVSVFTSLSQASLATVLFSMDIVVHAKDIMNANASIIYRKKGDFTSYGVDFDQYVYKTIPSVVVQFKLVKFPAKSNWKNGDVVIDVTFDFCETSTKKRRGGDVVAKSIFQIWEKYGNVTLACPIKKGYFCLRGMTFQDIKIPFMQYFLTEMDVNLKLIFFAKTRSKLIPLETVSYFGGLRITKKS